MTIFGNRDSASASDSARDGDAAATNQPSRVRLSFDVPKERDVILRVHGDERIVVGRADGRDDALQLARDLVRRIEQATTSGEWPQVEERFIRPGAIVSVDVQRSV